MIEKSRLKELGQNITSKQKEMEEVKAKRAAAAGNPAEMVILDKEDCRTAKDFGSIGADKAGRYIYAAGANRWTGDRIPSG